MSARFAPTQNVVNAVSGGYPTMLSPRVWTILACPLCAEPLARTTTGAACAECGSEYATTLKGQLDARLRGKKRYNLQLDYGGELPLREGLFEPFETAGTDVASE